VVLDARGFRIATQYEYAIECIVLSSKDFYTVTRQKDSNTIMTRTQSIFSAVAVLVAGMIIPMRESAAQNGNVPAGGQYRIGVVNIQNVFEAYDRQKAEYESLETERDSRQKEIDKLSEKITKAKERYDNEKDTMSAEQREALEDAIQKDYDLYQAEFTRLQKEIDRREKKILEDLFDDIRQAVREVGHQNNYHLILEGGETGASGVLYFSTTLNMTQKVIDYLNAQYAQSN